MTTQKWTTLPPMKEKRSSHAVGLQGDRIIVCGGSKDWSDYLDTCEAFYTTSKRFVLPHPCSASHHCLRNAYSINVNLPSSCSWSNLPRMTVKRAEFSLVCLPPDEGGLIAIGGYNPNYLDIVECLDGEGATKWRRLAPLPLPLSSRGVVYFEQRILVVGGQLTGGAKTSATLSFHPPTAGGLGQWVTLKPTLTRPEFPRHIAICGNSLYLVSKFTSQHDS